MLKNNLYNLLARIAKIKKGEETITLLLFSYFFFITAPYTIIKALRTSELLNAYGIKALPPAYLLTAILTGFVVVLHSKIQVRVSKQLLIISSLVFFILTGMLFWLFFTSTGDWLRLIYWPWANILVVVLMTHFWITVNEIFNPREARRLIGFFGSGGLLGGVFGGLLVKLLAEVISTHLLLFAFGMFIACIFVIKAIFSYAEKLPHYDKPEKTKKEFPNTHKVGFIDSFQAVRKNHYLVLIALLVTVSMIVSTSIDFQFNSLVNDTIKSKDNMTAFYGLFYSLLMLFAFFLQLLMTSKLIKRFGIKITLFLSPLILFIGSIGIAAAPLLGMAIFLKGSEKSLSLSLNQSIREILYIPVSPELKFKAKVFIDMFLNRFAKGICAILLFILTYFHLGISYISILSIIFLGIWVILNLKISLEYVSIVKENIKIKWVSGDKAVSEKLDVDYTKLIFDTLESKNRSSVLYALHVFDLLQHEKLSPEVKQVISQKSDTLKAISIGDMFGAEGALVISESEEDFDKDILKTDINEIMSLDAYQKVMKIHADKVMDKSKEAEIEKMELAKAIGLMNPDSPMADKLETLIYDDSPEVSRYAIESAAKLKQIKFIPALIHLLGNPLTRGDAISALIKFGPTAISTMGKFMEDSKKDLKQRKAVVEVFANIHSKETVDILLNELEKRSSDLDLEVINSLDKIRSENPNIHFRTRVVKRKTFLFIKKYCRIFIELQELNSAKKNRELMEKMRKELSISLISIFKLLGLYYHQVDIIKAYQNIKTGTKHSIAYAIELLDNILKKDIRDFVLPLIEEHSQPYKIKKFHQLLKNLPK